jgi:hypothetical protein
MSATVAGHIPGHRNELHHNYRLNRVVRETQSGSRLGLILLERASVTISGEIRSSGSLRRCRHSF